MQFKKYFTPHEAQETLPLVKRIVKDILDVGHQINSMATILGEEADNHPQIEELVRQLDTYFSELEELGCFYKDWNFSMGLVDFPAIINGNEVFLCWRSDETEVKYFHSIKDGYAGRQPIPNHYLVTAE